ncbi:MAG: hypothetical protein AB7I27_00080 [Bacteriovoracaceae bacterium]
MEIKNPKLNFTLAMLVGCIISFLGVISPFARTDVGFSVLGYICIVGVNFFFWGMVYRISKHCEFYLQGRTGAGFFRILIVASFVVSFIFLLSFGTSKY